MQDKANEDCNFKIAAESVNSTSINFNVELNGFSAAIAYAISKIFLKKNEVFEIFEAGLLLKGENIDSKVLQMALNGRESLEVTQKDGDVMLEMKGDPRSIALMIGFLLADQKDEKPLQDIFKASVMTYSAFAKKENADNQIYREIKKRIRPTG